MINKEKNSHTETYSEREREIVREGERERERVMEEERELRKNSMKIMIKQTD